MSRPFLSIVTRRHPARPGLYAAHLASLAAQTWRDFEHVAFSGGNSVAEANRSLHLNRARVRGDYVLVLDDDDRLADPDALKAIHEAAATRPGVVFVRMMIDGKPYPTPETWGGEPKRRHIGSTCFAVRRDLWQRHVRFWAQPRAGDYFFIRAVMRTRPAAVWLDRVCSETMQVGEGRGEAPAAPSPAAPSLVTFVPYDASGDLGAAYNDAMGRLREDEWGVFLDHDAMWLTLTWHAQLRAAIAANPRAGLLTATTNRIGFAAQLDRSLPGHDVAAHRAHAAALAERHGHATRDVTALRPGISGVVVATPRRAWEAVKARNGRGFASGFLGVDNAYHRDVAAAGYTVHVLRGLYVYHWYRGDGDRSHLTNGRRVAVQT